ncbi:MAG: nucleoside triphosphate pyrophosphohydrolase [Xanthomonadales bacterium]|nr:nucleoside triphosphate pyrophosphohydrolase [Xanthomonadales bacterium]
MRRHKIDQLLEIMAQLRDPESGCPWDREQDFASIAPYTIEEAYEVADAIHHGQMDELKDELGDLLFQVVFHARMAQEQQAFDFNAVVEAVCDKMIRRHPHVFAAEADSKTETLDAAAQTEAWEQAKAQEREARGARSLLDGVPRGMAELQRAVKLQKRAAQVGFDWGSPEPVMEKFAEEALEMLEAMQSGNLEAMEDELGDLLFVVTNLARQLKIDPARALRRANAKFELRFRAVEQAAGDREKLEAMPLDEMEELWQQAKLRHRQEGIE